MTRTDHHHVSTLGEDRSRRAMATLRFTGTRTTHDWLGTLCRAKYVELAALEKLRSTLLTTRNWRIQ